MDTYTVQLVNQHSFKVKADGVFAHNKEYELWKEISNGATETVCLIPQHRLNFILRDGFKVE